MGIEYAVHNDASFNLLVADLKAKKMPFVVEVISGHRTLPQNRLQHLMYAIIAKQLYGGDESFAKRECKLRLGVPILRRDSDDFSDVYDRIIKPASYEDKLEMMRYISVSSLFDKDQGSEYIDKIFNEYPRSGVHWSDLVISQVATMKKP